MKRRFIPCVRLVWPIAAVAVAVTVTLPAAPSGMSALTRAGLTRVMADRLPSLPSLETTVRVGANPTSVITDPATHTVYVANSNDSTVSVFNGAACNAQHTSGCGQVPATIILSGGALGLALNPKTRTLYVTNPAVGTVSVINAATCNATDTSGCQALATVSAGRGATVPAIDQATDTVYVPNGSNDTVSVINGAVCNAQVTSGCGRVPATVTVGSGPGQATIDKASHTVYVGNFTDGTISVINGATCNAQHASGCAQAPTTVRTGSGPGNLLVDPAVGTVYVANFYDNTISMISTTACNATNTSGCAQNHPTTPVGTFPLWITLNPLTGTVYTANQEDSSLSAINAATCNAAVTSGCQARPPTMASGFNPGGLAADPSTGTVYATSQDNGTVWVLNGATCDAAVTTGCTRYAPVTAVGSGPQAVAVSQATHTIYVANANDNTVSVISAAACNPARLSGCRRTWPTITVGSTPLYGMAIDQATGTIYVTNLGGRTVSVINGATCNAKVASGCGQTPATLTVGQCPSGAAIDQATRTAYVANLCSNTVSVINTATCNAQNTTGCGQTPPTITVGSGPIPVAVNQATNTIYVGNNGGGTVSVINGATCNAHTTSGCSRVPPAVTVTGSPFGLAADQHTDTIYVASLGSTVSVINGATCNAQNTTGCGQVPFPVPAADLGWDVAVNPATGAVYVTSVAGSAIAVINAASCNGQDIADCQPRLLRLRTGGWPSTIGLDLADRAMYIPDNADRAVSVLPIPP
jgi:YVTN family beta-propeller protein